MIQKWEAKGRSNSQPYVGEKTFKSPNKCDTDLKIEVESHGNKSGNESCIARLRQGDLSPIDSSHFNDFSSFAKSFED